MNGIRPVKKDPYNKIKVSETIFEKDKEKQENEENEKKFNIFLAYLMNIFQKMVKFLSSEKSHVSADKILVNTVAELKNYLKKIQEEDVSSNLVFFQNFSREWKKILKIYHLTKIDSSKKNLLKALIDEFQKFPQSKEFSISYYLKSYQNEGVVAHAATELIQMLHLDYQKNLENSILKNWISLLNKILTS